jgi:hypothetical protein
VRSDLGVVAVVMSGDSAPEVTLAYPVPSRAGAATVGAGAGLGVGVAAGAGCLGSYGLLWPACLVAVWTPVMMATGAVEGTVKGVPISDLRASVVAIKEAAREPAPVLGLGERVAGEATQRLGSGRGRFVPDLGGRAGAAPGRSAALAGAGVGTVLELRVARVALERASHPRPLETYGPSFSVERLIDAPLTLVVEVRARLLRAADGSELWGDEFTHRAGDRKLTEWGRDGAAQFRDERDRALARLADDVAGAVFGPAPAPSAPPSFVPPSEPAPPAEPCEDRI